MHSGKRFALVTALSSLIFGIAATAIASDSPATLAQISQQEKPKEQAIVIEDDNFKFQLQGCQRTDLKVTCSLLITNLAEKGRNFALYATSYNSGASRCFDFSGNEYYAQMSQVGVGNSQTQGESAVTNLPKGIPIKASVSFEIPRQVNQLAAIELTHNIRDRYGMTTPQRKIMFRDVAIVRSK